MNEENSPKRRFLTVQEAAALTRLAPATLYKLASKGEVPVQRMRRRLLFPADELDLWIAAGGEMPSRDQWDR